MSVTAPDRSTTPSAPPASALRREMGLLGLVATGVCAMVGFAINVLPFMLQRQVPGIGPWVLAAFVLGAVPAVLAGLAFAVLASAMPRAGGSYIYVSRGLDPYLGFVASFSQWFSLSIAIGVVSYVFPAFVRDVGLALGWAGATLLDAGAVKLAVSLGTLALFTAVNLRGIGAVERTVVPLMFLTLALGSIAIVAGFAYDHADFAAALAREGRTLTDEPAAPAPSLRTLLPAAAILFSSFLGFDTIAQAGGEARNASRTLPLAILLAVGIVAAFYLAFAAAVYHTVPWAWLAEEAQRRDVTAPGLLALLLPKGWSVLLVAGAAVALAKDLPAMLLGVSRLMFAWAEDGVMPRALGRIDPVRGVPDRAILASAAVAALGIVGCHVAGSFFLGVDILVTAMLVNFLLMCATVLALPGRNPVIARAVRVLPERARQVALGLTGCAVLAVFLAVHTWRDLSAPVAAWYFRSTWLWLGVMAFASLVYFREVRRLRRGGIDTDARFRALPGA